MTALKNIITEICLMYVRKGKTKYPKSFSKGVVSDTIDSKLGCDCSIINETSELDNKELIEPFLSFENTSYKIRKKRINTLFKDYFKNLISTGYKSIKSKIQKSGSKLKKKVDGIMHTINDYGIDAVKKAKAIILDYSNILPKAADISRRELYLSLL